MAIRELSSIQFEGSLGEAFKKYSREGQHLSKHLAFEYEMAAATSRAALSRLAGKWLLFGIDSKVKGRLVAKRAKRMSELAAGMSVELRKFDEAYRKLFLHLPRKDLKVSKL